MKKRLLFLTLILVAAQNSLAGMGMNLPMPINYNAQPGGGIVASMRATENLRQQQLQTQMMQERLAMMQQQRAAMESQNQAAQLQSFANIPSTLNSVSYQLKRNSLIIFVDQSMALGNLDQQIRLGMYNRSLTKNKLIDYTVIYLTVSSMIASTSIIPRVYCDHPNLNYISVYVHAIGQNLNGKNIITPLLSFNMSRNLNNKINWHTFNAAKANKVYMNFKFAKWAGDSMSQAFKH